LDAIQTPSIYDARRLQRDLAWLLAAKFAALGILWLLFFSAVHQPAIDASAAGRQLAVGAATP
jgi:hypothetical protein